MSSIVNILPALAFLLILLSISAYIQRTSKENRQRISPRITSSAAVLSAALCWL